MTAGATHRALDLRGVDAAGHPPAHAVVASGRQVVAWYDDGPFAPSVATVRSYEAAGLGQVSIFEHAAQAALRGAAGGVADAKTALRRAAFYEVPPHPLVGLVATVDFDPTPGQMPTVHDYLHAFSETVRGSSYGSTGYGGTAVLEACHPVVDFTWQAAGWSNGVLWPADMRQLLTQTHVGGVQVDEDDVLRVPFGAWCKTGPWPASSHPTPNLEDDVKAHTVTITCDHQGRGSEKVPWGPDQVFSWSPVQGLGPHMIVVGREPVAGHPHQSLIVVKGAGAGQKVEVCLGVLA